MNKEIMNMLVFVFGICLWLFSGCSSKEKGVIRLQDISSPVLFSGNETSAYRDPAVLYHNNTFYLFFTLVEIEEDGNIYSYLAGSESKNLKEWSSPKKLTEKNQRLNYSSPGNVIRHNDEWVLCLQTYPRPEYTIRQDVRYADETARVFVMRSKDLSSWSAPELLKLKGESVSETDMGRMIDPYLIQDKDDKDKYWCFFKQNGVSLSWSNDLKTWNYFGHTDAGENVCVLVDNNEYVLFHSPENGVGVKRTADLKEWHDWGKLITLGQAEWDWAKGRITAGVVLDMRDVDGVNKYLMFYHGSGPLSEPEGDFDKNASIGIAWSSDLKSWDWPGK